MKKLIIISLLLVSCANMTPKQQTILKSVETFALNTALGAASAYLTGGGTSPAFIANSIDGAAQVVRSIIDTPAVTNPQAIQDAVATGSVAKVVDAKVAPAVAQKAASAIQAGVNPNAVVEATAKGLNQAAAELRAKPTP
jgi:hypothetical protein